MARFTIAELKAGTCSMTELARVIDLKLSRWPGNCDFVATKLVAYCQLPGRVVRGHYHGRISADSVFGSRVASQHSWIETKTNVLDPTRWAFTPGEAEVGVWVGSISGSRAAYDVGGSMLRDYQRVFKTRVLPNCTGVAAYTVPADLQELCHGVARLDAAQLGWLANTPLHSMDRNTARSMYKWLCSLGKCCYIPMDWLDYVHTKSEVKALRKISLNASIEAARTKG